MITDSEKLEIFDASEMCARRLNTKEVFKLNHEDYFLSPIANEIVKTSVTDWSSWTKRRYKDVSKEIIAFSVTVSLHESNEE